MIYVQLNLFNPDKPEITSYLEFFDIDMILGKCIRFNGYANNRTKLKETIPGRSLKFFFKPIKTPRLGIYIFDNYLNNYEFLKRFISIGCDRYDFYIKKTV